jgi:hypothetical protein
MFCTRCGNPEGDDAVYCSSCGTRLASQAPAGESAGLTPAPAGPPAPPEETTTNGARHVDPYQQDYERAKATGFPQPQQAKLVQGSSATAGQRSSTSIAPFLLVLGGCSLAGTIILQFIKVSASGVSISASQANAICQSAIGQFGQAFSSGFGNNGTVASACGEAATIEDWKGITAWLGIALICVGLVAIALRADWAKGQAGSRPAAIAKNIAAGDSAEAKLAAAERAEANAALLRSQAAQMKAEQAQPQQPPPIPSDLQGGGI